MADTSRALDNVTTIVRSSNTDFQNTELYQQMMAIEQVTAQYVSDIGMPILAVILLLYLSYRWVKMTSSLWLSYSAHEQEKSNKIMLILDKLIEKLGGK